MRREKLKLLFVCALVLLLGVAPVAQADWKDGDGHKMHFPQLPDEDGWNVNATRPLVLADDWECSETGWVKDIHFWGSWRHGDTGEIIKFVLSIHEDIPADPLQIPYSRPGKTLWELPIYDFDMVPIDPPTDEGWYDPNSGTWIHPDHQNYFQYNIILPEHDWFPQNEGEIYWLNISAELADPENTQWGWKSTEDHWNDDAVWALWGDLGWKDMFEPEPFTPTDTFWINIDPGGGFAGGGGSGYVDPMVPDPFAPWYYYEYTEWWNQWYYNGPFDPNRDKIVHIEFMVQPFDMGFPMQLELALNWSTPEWPPQPQPEPVPPLPSLVDPMDEDMYIRREHLLTIDMPGFYTFDYIIRDYNPEWVSIDVRGYNFSIIEYPEGIIEHTCVQSLDLAFVITGGVTEPDLDFGDAPEGWNVLAYPSTCGFGSFPTCINPNPGPAMWIQHTLSYNLFFGPLVDAENEGNWGLCPNCFPPYDQDECFNDGDAGLIRPPSYTIQGPVGLEKVVPCGATTASLGTVCDTAEWGTDIDIRVTNNTTKDAYVNVLADWNKSGEWSGSSTCPDCLGGTDAPEHILVDFPVPPGYSGSLSGLMGAAPATFVIGPNPEYIWTRFTVTPNRMGSGWPGDGVFDDGETEDYLLKVDPAPASSDCDWREGDDHKMHWPQLPDLEPNGIDVDMMYTPLADDFNCVETGWITDIHFWGSFADDCLPVGGYGSLTFEVEIYSNRRADENPLGYSEPNELVWGPYEFAPCTYTAREVADSNEEWWYDPVTEFSMPANHFRAYQYNICIDSDIAFEQKKGKTYWLRIKDIVPAGFEPDYTFGWKTTRKELRWNDDAVWWDPDSTVGWTPLKYPPGHPYEGLENPSIDLAFVITGEAAPPEELEFGDAPEGDDTIDGDAIAYPSLGVDGQFPTCITVGNLGWVESCPLPGGGAGMWFGPMADFELDGDASLCPNCFPTYDDDECFADGDAGLIMPEAYTIIGPAGAESVVPCPQCNGTPLGSACQWATWGIDIDIDVTNTFLAPYDVAYVNVLMDWNHSGEWSGASTCANPGDAPEYVLVDWPVSAGYSGPLSLDPCGPPPPFLIGPETGYVWARFSITHFPLNDPDWNGAGSFNPGSFYYGETEDYLLEVVEKWEPKPPVPHIKWSQPPIEINPVLGRMPTYCGWDEPSWLRLPGGPTTQMCAPRAADDFRCLGSMPITSVHWWGSHYGWEEQGTDPPVLPVGWLIRFWSNIPEGTGVDNFSRPGEQLWSIDVRDADRVQVETAGKDEFGDLHPKDVCYQYTLYLDPCEYFPQNKYVEEADGTIGDTVFWISIQALYPPEAEIPPYPWGWKTRPWSWMDDAVRRVPVTGDPPCVWEPIEDPHCYESFDLAFELDTDPNYIKWEQAFTGFRRWLHYWDEESMGIEVIVTPTKGEVQEPNIALTGLHCHDGPKPTQNLTIADDWHCDGGEVTDLHWYGNYEVDSAGQEKRGSGIRHFHLSIHEPNQFVACLPGQELWSTNAMFPAQVSETDTGLVNSEGCKIYLYEYDLVNPFPQTEGEDYWFDIGARCVDPANPAVWRWQEAGRGPTPTLCGAADRNDPSPGVWRTIEWDRSHLTPPEPNWFSDMAFAITSGPGEPNVEIIRLVADDWPCTKRQPVTAAVWWGSYIGYRYTACDDCDIERPQKPDYFLLQMWTDVPANPDEPDSYSHPDVMIWEFKAYDYDEVLVGFDKYPEETDPIGGLTDPQPREPVFRYSVRLPKEHWFHQKEDDAIFWFSVVAVYKERPDGTEIPYPWGWTNHEHLDYSELPNNDDAVEGYPDDTPGTTGGWTWNPLYDQAGNTEDMSFILFTEPGCFPSTPDYAVQYAAWVYAGKPECWCDHTYAGSTGYQCYGDAAGDKQYSRWWVFSNDLTVLITEWKKLKDDPTLNWCADMDHEVQYARWPVFSGDLTVLITNWKSTTLPDPPDCPKPD